MSDQKPAVVEAVLGEKLEMKQIVDPQSKELFAYPSGSYGSPWREGDKVDIFVGPNFPRYPTSSVCQVVLESSVRQGLFIVARARQINTSDPNKFYGDWYEC